MGAEVRVEITGVLASLKSFSARVDEEVLDALDECAALVANHAKTNHPKAPDAIVGEHADAFRMQNLDGSYRFLTRTGNLRNSILPRRAVKEGRGFIARVVSGMEYSDKIEFGSVENRPFPFMRPAIETNRDEILRRVRLAVRRGIEG